MGKSNPSMRMWGYLPAASLQRAPLLLPTRAPQSSLQGAVRSVCGGGCGFALAITESGKIGMWGSTNDLGQSYDLRGSLQEQVEPYLLDVNANIVQADGGWAHSVAVTDKGDVFMWGWSECVPTARLTPGQGAVALPSSSFRQGDGDAAPVGPSSVVVSDCSTPSTLLESSKRTGARSARYHQKTAGTENSSIEQLSSCNEFRSNLPPYKRTGSKTTIEFAEEDNGLKQSAAQGMEEANSGDTSMMNGNLTAPPSLLSLAPDVIIKSVAAGGRHTLALSDAGKVWGWGYCGEGQLGLGSCPHMISTPQRIQSLEASHGTCNGSSKHNKSGQAELLNLPPRIFGTCVTRIACGGRHSAVLTDAGAVLTFGWGLYGQCGQGSTEDQLSPVYVSALGGMKVMDLAAGLWHTMFITDAGDVYACGGNQFGQLGICGDQAEMLPTLVDAPVLENETATSVSCGARHTAVLTDKGKIFCWGWNKYGQLGTGDTRDRDTPVEVALESGVARSMACGWWHTLALVEEDLSLL